MRTTVRQLYASAAASGDNAASLQIVKKGVISAIVASVSFDSITDGGIVNLELSTAPVFQGVTNDPLGPLLQVKSVNNLLTSGMTNASQNFSVGNIAIPVEPGVLLYINANVTGTVTYRCAFLIYVTTP